jgi:hypothetical protein
VQQAKLIAEGYDPDQVKTLPTYTALTNVEEVRRDTVNEYEYTGDEANQAARRIETTEHYIRMDYAGDGRARLYKVRTGGQQGDILIKDGKPDVEEFDDIPFAAMTPVIQTHRFFGRSIADLVMDIQRIKTALLRALLDNAYLANNPRVEVAEQFAGPETLDDLLVSRPGGIVRTRQPGGLNWQTVPSIAAQTFPVLEYMDAARELRTGVTRQGQGIDDSVFIPGSPSNMRGTRNFIRNVQDLIDELGNWFNLTKEEKEACYKQFDYDEKQCYDNHSYNSAALSGCLGRAETIRDQCLRGLKEVRPWTDVDTDGVKIPPRRKKK